MLMQKLEYITSTERNVVHENHLGEWPGSQREKRL